MKASDHVCLGRTATRVTRLSIGGTPFGDMYDIVPDGVAAATVRRAYELGVKAFDTAPLYGVGKSERRLGLGLQGIARDDVTVSTKVGRILQDDDGTIAPTFEYSVDAVRASLASSKARTGLSRFDIVHVHDPDNHMDEALVTAFPTLRELQAAGEIGAVGAGMNHAAPLARFVEAGVVDCVLLSGRWSLLEQGSLDTLLPLALERQVSVIAAGVFNTGVLADPDADAKFVNYNYRPASAEVLARVATLRSVCERHGVSLRSAALQFPLLHPAVATVLVGCRSPQEVEQNVADLGVEIPEELWAELRDRALVRFPPR